MGLSCGDNDPVSGISASCPRDIVQARRHLSVDRKEFERCLGVSDYSEHGLAIVICERVGNLLYRIDDLD